MNRAKISLSLSPKRLASRHQLGGMALLLCTSFLISLTIGAVDISLKDVMHIFLNQLGLGSTEVAVTKSLVLTDFRLPRLLFTVLIGAALGVSGAALQGLFRNPLVEPGIIGVSSGAALGAIFIILGLEAFLGDIPANLEQWLMPPFAFFGGAIATYITLKLGNYKGQVRITILILAGVAITSMASAIIGLAIFYSDEQQLRTFTFWTLGDLSGATWTKIYVITLPILGTIAGLCHYARSLNALALGESEAYHSGVNVERVKKRVVLLSAVAVGTAVAFAGVIGFLGLVIPHIIRMTISSDHRIVIPGSAIGGALLLILADIVARTAVAPAELPIGIITASVGTPFFIYLLTVAKRKNLI
ncbi:FecCD family ABC transporter permease [Roseivirga sp.]|uniref:FecCD family ABC transporter permease n=1 Tax=Roseivirga sp. TaxID=1964215 RepID=UPI003B51E6EF